MALDNCPHCGSKYVNFKEQTEDHRFINDIYICQNCKERITVKQNKEELIGEWLMSVYDDKSFGIWGEALYVYKTAKGIQVRQKWGSTYITKKLTPKIEVKYTYVYDTPIYYLTVSTFGFNDQQGDVISAKALRLNPELTKKAMQNEAMKAIRSGDGFLIGESRRETTLLGDIKVFLDSTLQQESGTAGKCYVATAVYGSYDCPQVWTLRRFRDNILAESWYGRAFIHTYYAISPTLVKWFGHTAWFKNMWRDKLDRMVNKLQKQGVESTPYQDRNW